MSLSEHERIDQNIALACAQYVLSGERDRAQQAYDDVRNGLVVFLPVKQWGNKLVRITDVSRGVTSIMTGTDLYFEFNKIKMHAINFDFSDEYENQRKAQDIGSYI